MGIDIEEFVDGDRISNQLICPICQGVLENPVQTDCDHLFCEDELLEWLTRADTCPVDNLAVEPSQIGRPSRIILNLLGELVRRCPNREEGCTWTGAQDNLAAHVAQCEHVPRDELRGEIRTRDTKIVKLRGVVAEQAEEIEQLRERLLFLNGRATLIASTAQAYESLLEEVEAEGVATLPQGWNLKARALAQELTDADDFDSGAALLAQSKEEKDSGAGLGGDDDDTERATDRRRRRRGRRMDGKESTTEEALLVGMWGSSDLAGAGGDDRADGEDDDGEAEEEEEDGNPGVLDHLSRLRVAKDMVAHSKRTSPHAPS